MQVTPSAAKICPGGQVTGCITLQDFPSGEMTYPGPQTTGGGGGGGGGPPTTFPCPVVSPGGGVPPGPWPGLIAVGFTVVVAVGVTVAVGEGDVVPDPVVRLDPG